MRCVLLRGTAVLNWCLVWFCCSDRVDTYFRYCAVLLKIEEKRRKNAAIREIVAIGFPLRRLFCSCCFEYTVNVTRETDPGGKNKNKIAARPVVASVPDSMQLQYTVVYCSTETYCIILHTVFSIM